MPIYGYKCTRCGHELEVMQSFSDKPLHTCPVCMGPLRKQLYPVGVIYKGSGYYTTDYKGSGSTRSEDSKGKAKSGDASGGEAGSKEKPASAD